MLYHVIFQIDQQALGFGPERQQTEMAEIEALRNLTQEGVLKAAWQRADGAGSVLVVDAEDHDALSAILQAQPMFRFLKHTAVMPLVEHQALPSG